MEHHGSASPGEKLISGEELTRYDAARVCEVPQCATRLSSYNPDPLCSQHRGWGLDVVPRPRRRPVVHLPEHVDWMEWAIGKRSADAQ